MHDHLSSHAISWLFCIFPCSGSMRVSACDSSFMHFQSLLVLVFKELTGGGLSQAHGTGNAHDLGLRVLQRLHLNPKSM